MTARALSVIRKTKDLVDFRRKLLHLKLKAFQPKIKFQIEQHGFLIKTAETIPELEEILKLRYQVFIREGLNKKKLLGVDFDRYDLLADHILVKDIENNVTIGTYRLLSSKFTNDFYSQNEFLMNQFLLSPGIKLELGRACIHPFYRNGTSLNLVWKGLGQYARLTQADYLFGCASVHTTSAQESMALFRHLKDFHGLQYGIQPTANFRFKDAEMRKSFLGDTQALDEKLPSLLKSYLKAGAQVHGLPAYDKDFDCIDFMTIINVHTMNSKYKGRYFTGMSSVK